jgi:glycosyltransferase involved in cell wall biosynthesis
VWQKGLDILLDAWQQICQNKQKEHDFRLLMVGTGADAEQLQRRLANAELPGITWVNEFVNDPERIRRYLCAADVYVFPSRHEGFPVAPIEAMACGLPVVAAAVQGISDIFVAGESSGGIVVPRENASGLAFALERVLNDPNLSLDLGSRARARVEAAFSLMEVGHRLRDFMFENATVQQRGLRCKQRITENDFIRDEVERATKTVGRL